MNDEVMQSLVDQSEPPAAPINSDVDGLHRLVEISRIQLLGTNADHDGILRTSAGALDIRVSQAVVDRAMAILNELVKRWELRGGTLQENATTGTPSRFAFAIGPDSLGVQLAENVDEDKPLTDTSRLTARLALHIIGAEDLQFRRRWSDTKSQRLERMLGAFCETLANALAIKHQQRLDNECVVRQKKRVETVRTALNRDSSHEFYSRQSLMQNVQRWLDAQHVRGYLKDLRSAFEAGSCRPLDADKFEDWFGWASRFADSIDPIAQGPLPEANQRGHQNIATSELDLTAATHRTIEKLEVSDTDSLWNLSQDAVRKACEGRFGPVWNEFTRVLEGLGYDVSKRQEASAWC